MTVKRKVNEETGSDSELHNTPEKRKCFVIMPISDHPDYESGHFDRVYEEIIRPAVVKAGFVPKRADDIKQTHVIILDILKSVVDSDMAICDLSSLNPNVMYELGIRQMTKKPVVLIKDFKTKRIFDIGILSDVEYDPSLRVDKVRNSVEEISDTLKNTFENMDNKTNSLIDLLGVDVQIEKRTIEVSAGEKLILQSINKLLSENSNKFPSFRNISIGKFNQLKLGKFHIHPGSLFRNGENVWDQTVVYLTSDPEKATFLDLRTLEQVNYSGDEVLKILNVWKRVNPVINELEKTLTQEQIIAVEKIEESLGIRIQTPF